MRFKISWIDVGSVYRFICLLVGSLVGLTDEYIYSYPR